MACTASSMFRFRNTTRHLLPQLSCFKNVTAINSISKRHYLPLQVSKLESFDKRTKFYNQKFKEQERKLLLSRVVQTLENPDLELLVQDAVTYIYLAEKEDTQYFLPLVTKCYSQMQRDRENGMLYSSNLKLVAMKKCYMLNDPKTALEIVNADVSGDKHGKTYCVLMTMDLFLENRMHAECLDLAMRTLAEETPITVNWFYQLAIMSAFQLNTKEDLTKAAKIFDVKQIYQKDSESPSIGTSNRQLQRVMAMYCIKQNHLNAALTLINSITPATTVELNLKVLAYLHSDNLDAALRVAKMITVRNSAPEQPAEAADVVVGEVSEGLEDGESEGVEQSPAVAQPEENSIQGRLFRDVFFELRDAILEKEDDVGRNYLRFLNATFDDTVAKSKLPGYLTRLRQFSYQATMQKLMKESKKPPTSDTPSTELMSDVIDVEEEDKDKLESAV
ncbi:hypothetical protein EB796_018120 [Bugula neritina]|uniref:PTCD2 n=1 Tax=Bugula neritina TaxID=10212 RepID=A0A7J7JD82_BUGNE|nr:hypothetical protein EB796_018120 [Bugula neritina]